MINWFKNLFKKKQPKKEWLDTPCATCGQKLRQTEDKKVYCSHCKGPIYEEAPQESRTLPQNESRCPNCDGGIWHGCPDCGDTGEASPLPTLEELIDAVPVIDLRHEQPNPPPLYAGKRKHRIRNGLVSERKAKDITGLVIHQTAARYGVSAQQIKAAGGDKRLAMARRGLGVACHAIVFWNDGEPFVCLTNPLKSYVYHGNGFNATTLGIEVDGDFAGLLSDPTTAFRKKENPDRLEEKLKIAFFKGAKTLLEEAEKEGIKISKVYAHRQSSPTRRSDPGEEIWGAVLEYVVPVLGLETDPGLIKLKGYSIPKEWDPEGTGYYHDKPKQ